MASAEQAEELLGAQLRDGVDPELMALPAPARGRRVATMAVMALAVVAAVALLTGLRGDLAYYFQDSVAVNLGEATAIDAAALGSNRYVSIHGTPMASRTIEYSRVFGGDFAVFPLAGQRRVFVQAAVGERALQTSRREFSGRLVTMGELGGRLGAVRRAYEGIGEPVTAQTYVLLADEPPGSYSWALALAGLCIVFALINLLLLLRWFRPIRVRRRAAG